MSTEATQVHLASDSEVQNVIDFLSHPLIPPDPLTDEQLTGKRGDMALGYPSSNGTYGAGYRNERLQPTSDNSSSGSSGIGMEGPYLENGREQLRSRSMSMSPVGGEVERNVDGKQNGLGSTDSGINVLTQQSKHRSHDLRMTQNNPETQERAKRKSKEMLDFSGGFGPITNTSGGGDR